MARICPFGSSFMVALACVVAALGISAAPANAQGFSNSYEFLKAVRDRDGAAVTQALDEPGSVLINTRDRTSGETGLHIATRRRDTVWIRFLLERGADPNIVDKEGATPLTIAVALGHFDGVAALVAGGARLDVPNATGETALIAAVHRRDLAIVKLLLENGASADRNDNSGRSARDYIGLMKDNSMLAAALATGDRERAGQAQNGGTYGPSFP